MEMIKVAIYHLLKLLSYSINDVSLIILCCKRSMNKFTRPVMTVNSPKFCNKD